MLLDVAGHRRSPATMLGYHRGRPPCNKGEQYPADPPTVEEIVAVMGTIGGRAEGQRLRALMVLLARRSTDQRSARTTGARFWTDPAARCSSGAARAARVASSRSARCCA
jgi:hypothetical protein